MRLWAESGYVAIDLPADVGRAFSEGYANDTLWPLLHGFPDRVVIDPETWPAYRAANERFAAGIAARLDASKPRLGPRLPAHARSGARPGGGAWRGDRLLPPRAVPGLGNLPDAPGARGRAAGCAGRGPRRVPDPRRPPRVPAGAAPGDRHREPHGPGRGGRPCGPPRRLPHRHRRRGVDAAAAAGQRPAAGGRAAPASRGAAPRLCRRPPRLHEGHPGAPAGISTAPARGARASWQGHAHPGRGADARARAPLPRAPPRGQRAGRRR